MIKKKIARKYYKEQEERMFKQKLVGRYCSIDLNPEHIGVSILDVINEEGDFKIVDVFAYDLTELMSKNNKSSDHKDTKKLNNKRKHEIGNIYKTLFNKVKHYRCSHFVIEDLEFKKKFNKDEYKEFNRKTKNIWNRNLQINLINKYCNINGIILIKVNPVYSSFIGNIKYNFFDPINASIEIGRRGIVKYIKGSSLYPKLTSTIIDTAIKRFGLSDAQCLKINTWVKLYKLLTQTGVKYRWQLCDINHNCFSGNSIKSNWNIITPS